MLTFWMAERARQQAIKLYNPNHDGKGRFTSGGGAVTTVAKGQGATRRGEGGKRVKNTQASSTSQQGTIESKLSKLKDPTDPVEAWHAFGGTRASVFHVLRQEPIGVLKAMLRHVNMPEGSGPRFIQNDAVNRERAAGNISDRLDAHFNSGG